MTPSPLVLLALAALAPLTGEEPTAARAPDAMTAAFAEVDPADGIDAAEARILATAYFGWTISGCGGVDTPRLEGARWVCDSLVGRGAQPGPQVIVARDGSVVRADGHLGVRLSGGRVEVLEAGSEP